MRPTPAQGSPSVLPLAATPATPDDSRRVLETLIGNLPGIVYRCDNSPAWPISFISEGCRDITGWSPEDFLERRVRFAELIAVEDRERVWATVQEALSTRSPYVVTYRIHAREGREHWLWEKGCGVFDAGGEVLFLEGVVLDISQEKGLEQQLLQAQKMEAVGRLAGGVAHDFNNLLTAILGYSDMLAASLSSGSVQRNQAKQILRASQRAADLTRKLLAFARQQLVEPSVFDLSELILAVDPLLRRLIGEDVELVTLPGRGVGPIEADSGQIEQVLVNLAVNARQAMPEGGKLTISTDELELTRGGVRGLEGLPPGRYVRLSVEDTGVGMDRDTMAHVFEPFFTTKAKGEGTGLGLATCYGIVKQAGGDIAVDSASGYGTTFRVYLPRASGLRTSLVRRAMPGASSGGDETVLLVEDEPLVRRVAEEALVELGYNVLPARSGVEALELAASHPAAIDLLVTDMVMPQMSGREVARRLLETRAGTRVLYVSGYTENPVQIIAEPGMAFLAKPFTPRTLGASVRALLDAPAPGR